MLWWWLTIGLPWFNFWFSFTLSHSRISHEYSSLFIIVMNLIFMFSLWCIDWVGSLYANRIFMFFCIRVTSRPMVKLVGRKSALNPTVVYSNDRSKAVVSVLALPIVALWFILRGDLFYVLPYVILLLCFSVLLVLRLLRLGKSELILVLFIHICSIFACLVVSVFSSSWCPGRATVVALPGLVSYPFLCVLSVSLFAFPRVIIGRLLFL